MRQEINRRKFLIGAGAVGLAALAGCEDVDDETYGNGSNTSASGQDAPSEDEVQNRPEGEDHLTHEGLEITDYEMLLDEGEFVQDFLVGGVVENTTDERYDYVEVAVRVYDANGRHLDRYFTNTTDLAGGTEWLFEINILEDPGVVDSYDIAIIGNQY